MKTIANEIGFIRGRKDCKEGLPQQSSDPDYIRGYAAQYAIEQQLTAQGEANEPR